jgi:hypothetical protein
MYGSEFQQHLGPWSDKCKNKIFDYNHAIHQIKVSDVIIYPEIVKEKSLFCNTTTLTELMKPGCKLIKIPSIYIDKNNRTESLNELKRRENDKSVDIKVSEIFERYRNVKLMLNKWHPTTFLFLEIVRIICGMINIPFFHEKQYLRLLKNENFMGLSIQTV